MRTSSGCAGDCVGEIRAVDDVPAVAPMSSGDGWVSIISTVCSLLADHGHAPVSLSSTAVRTGSREMIACRKENNV